MKKKDYVGILVGSMVTSHHFDHSDTDIICVGAKKPALNEYGIDWWLPDDHGYRNHKYLLPFTIEGDFAALPAGLHVFPALTNFIYRYRGNFPYFPSPDITRLAQLYGLKVLDCPAWINLLPNRPWRCMQVKHGDQVEKLSDLVFTPRVDNELVIAPNAFTTPPLAKGNHNYIFRTVPGLHRFLEQQLLTVPLLMIEYQVYFCDEMFEAEIRDLWGNVIKTEGLAMELSDYVTFADRLPQGLRFDLKADHPDLTLYHLRLTQERRTLGQPDHSQPEIIWEDTAAAGK